MLVPHDQAPGRLGVYAQLWGRAAAAVLQRYVQLLQGALRAARPRASAGAGGKPPAAPSAQTAPTAGDSADEAASGAASSTMESGDGSGGSSALAHVEIALSVSRVAFKIEHHPLEAWMAVHGPVLQQVTWRA